MKYRKKASTEKTYLDEADYAWKEFIKKPRRKRKDRK